MNEAIIVAIISMAGTSLCSIISVFLANRLTTYRIRQLEVKQDKHNGLIERMVIVEQSTKSAHHRIDELVDELK